MSAPQREGRPFCKSTKSLNHEDHEEHEGQEERVVLLRALRGALFRAIQEAHVFGAHFRTK